MSNINTEIVPSNVTANGSISFRDGNPVIQFIIGEQDRLLLGNSIRFAGKFRCMLSSASSSVSDVSQLAMSERLGVYSCIDTLTIKSQKTGQTLESIRQYSREKLLDNKALGEGFSGGKASHVRDISVPKLNV